MVADRGDARTFRTLLPVCLAVVTTPMALVGQNPQAELEAALTEVYQLLNDGDADGYYAMMASVNIGEFPRNGFLRDAGPGSTTGPTTYPDGTVLNGTYRGSMFWVREGGQWKIVHSHLSPLETANSP